MWATWTDISEFTRKRSLMCVLTVERDSTRPPPCKTTKKSTPPTSLASALNAQRSSKLAEFCWSTYELCTSTQLKVLPRLVLLYILQLWNYDEHEWFQVTSNSVLFSYKKYANLVAPKTEEKVSTKCFYCEVIYHAIAAWFYAYCVMLIHIIQYSMSGLWRSIFIQASVKNPYDGGTWWTGGFSLQVICQKYILKWNWNVNIV